MAEAPDPFDDLVRYVVEALRATGRRIMIDGRELSDDELHQYIREQFGLADPVN